MPDKTAAIKVNLKGDQAVSEVGKIKDATKRAGGEMGSALQGALSTGLKGGVDAVKGAFASIKSVAMSVGGLVGGLGFAEITKQALEAKSKFSDLSFGVRAAGGTMSDVVAIQKQLQKGAIDAGQDSFKMVDAFEGIRRETGSLEFARGTIDTVSTAARGAHKQLETMANVTGTLNEKFGVTAAEMPDALADVVGLSEKGGVSFEDMAEKLGLIGAFAKEAGLTGRAGLGQMVGMLNLADNANGSFKKGLVGVGGLLAHLGTSSGKNTIGAALGLSGSALKGDVTSQIEAIMRATKGQKGQLEKAFGGEQLKLLVDLGKTYGAAFDSTKGDVKTKTTAAVEAVRGAFDAASKSTLTFADLQKEAATEMASAPQKLAVAKEKLLQAFSSEKFQAALNKVIDKLPALADLIAKIVGFAVDNPAAAGAAAIGGTFAKGAIESIIVGAFKSGAAAAAPSLSGALAGGAGPFASALGPLMGPIGLALGASLGIMLLASMHQAKLDQEKRDAEAKDAQKMLKSKVGPMGGAYQAAGALEAATGVEFDPNTAISDDTAGRATSGQDAHDKAMEERLMGKAKRGQDMLKFGNKLAQNHPDWFMTETNAQGVSPSASTGPLISGSQSSSSSSKSAGPSAGDLAAANASAIAGKKLQVFVTNAKDIGGPGGSGGGPTGKGFVVPGYLSR